jgi:peptidoglycan/LPS O-acetylase OafA/YrhL
LQAQRQIVGVDFVRFFAALSVTLFHLGYWVVSGVPGATPLRAANIPDVAFPEIAFLQHGGVGVYIFFVISGFVIAYSAEHASARGFLRSRLVRLVPAVWLVAPITFIAAWLIDFAPTADLVERLIRSLIFYPTGPWIDGVYWTLSIEIAFYASVFILLLVHRFKWITWLAMLIGGVSATYWVAALFSLVIPQWGYRPLELTLVHHGCFFALGVYLWLYFLKQRTVSRLVIILVLATACILKFAITESKPLVPCLIWFGAIAVLAASPSFNTWLTQSSLTRSVARSLGLATYPLYLLHDLVGAALLGWLYRQGFGPYSAMISATVTMILGSLLIARLVEPPCQRALVKFLDSITFSFLRSRFSTIVAAAPRDRRTALVSSDSPNPAPSHVVNSKLL